ncbi:MAG TPA: pantetheine-phosphate adenylyltransferase [bacterium]|jgi:pantetheine-phosphate adenylyltransferase
MTTAVYPGSFDPIHLGHLDVITRAARVFETVVVAVAKNSEKAPLFTIEERLDMLRETTQHLTGVKVESYDGLTVEYATQQGARVLVKGLRAIADFEYELKQAAMNQRLQPELDTIFFMTTPAYYFLSSSLIREVARLGGEVAGLVPPGIEMRLRAKFPRR